MGFGPLVQDVQKQFFPCNENNFFKPMIYLFSLLMAVFYIAIF